MQEDLSDEELMLKYQLGEEDAFFCLYSRHSGRVLQYLKLKTGDEAKVKDLFQSTFLKLHRSRHLYKPSFPFAPWLFTICRSEWLDSLRKEKQLKEDLYEEIPEMAQPMVPKIDLDLNTLSPPQREAIELRFEQDQSFEEIALTLRTSPSNARQLISRALRTLGSLYGKK